MKPKMNPFWGTLAVLVILASFALCVYGAREGTLYVQSAEQPKEVVVRFFNALTAQDYDTAYGCLSNYSSLGLENQPKDYNAGRRLEALRYSYAVTLSAPCQIRGGTAIQPVTLRALDFGRIDRALAQQPQGEGESAITLDEILSSPLDYCSSGDYEVHLRYVDGHWLIELDEPLLSALLGTKEASA